MQIRGLFRAEREGLGDCLCRIEENHHRHDAVGLQQVRQVGAVVDQAALKCETGK